MRSWCGIAIGKWTVTVIVQPLRWRRGIASGGILREAYLGPFTVMLGTR